jgi:hypothetical protein
MSCFDRPELLVKTLESIKSNDNYKDWLLVICIDPGSFDLFGTINATCGDWNRCVFLNPVRLGVEVNSFLVQHIAYQMGSEFNIYTDSDVVFSQDALALADWFRANTSIDRMKTILCFRRAIEDITKPDVVGNNNGGLLGTGFAYHRCLWTNEEGKFSIQVGWFYDRPDLNGYSWDWRLERYLITLGICQVRPYVNRSQTIGLYGQRSNGDFNPALHSDCFGGKVGKFTYEV